MIGWKSDIVVSLGAGRGTFVIDVIRNDGIVNCHQLGTNKRMFYDLDTGLLREHDPWGDNNGLGVPQPREYEDHGWAQWIVEQFVAAAANPQVKADQLYQGLKAGSVKLPSDLKLERNYLGGVMVFQNGTQYYVGDLIDYIMKGFDKG